MLIIGVDRLLDMLRTSINIAGDGMVSTVVARSEGYLDLDVFADGHPEDFCDRLKHLLPLAFPGVEAVSAPLASEVEFDLL